MWGSARDRFRARAGAGSPQSNRVSEKIGQGSSGVPIPLGSSARWLFQLRVVHGILFAGYVLAVAIHGGGVRSENPRGERASSLVVAGSGVVSHASVLIYTLVLGTSLHARHKVIGTSPWRWIHLWVFSSGALIIALNRGGGSDPESPERAFVFRLVTGGVPSLVAFIGGYIRWDSIIQGVARSVSAHEMAKEMLLYFHTTRPSKSQNPSSIAQFCVTVFDAETHNHAQDIYDCLQKDTAGASKPSLWVVLGATLVNLGVGALLILWVMMSSRDRPLEFHAYAICAVITLAHTTGLAVCIGWNRDGTTRRCRLDDHLLAEGRPTILSSTLPEIAVTAIFYGSVAAVATLIFLEDESYTHTVAFVAAHIAAFHHALTLEAISGGFIIAYLFV